MYVKCFSVYLSKIRIHFQRDHPRNVDWRGFTLEEERV